MGGFHVELLPAVSLNKQGQLLREPLAPLPNGSCSCSKQTPEIKLASQDQLLNTWPADQHILLPSAAACCHKSFRNAPLCLHVARLAKDIMAPRETTWLPCAVGLPWLATLWLAVLRCHGHVCKDLMLLDSVRDVPCASHTHLPLLGRVLLTGVGWLAAQHDYPSGVNLSAGKARQCQRLKVSTAAARHTSNLRGQETHRKRLHHMGGFSTK